MTFFRQYGVVLALLALAGVIVLLLSVPSLVFSPGVSFIDTELYRSTGKETFVRTGAYFGSQEHMAAFPREIGEWKGRDYDTAKLRELLGADVILLRGYDRPGLYLPVFLTIMQAQTESSFHAADICFIAQGYEIQERAKERLLVTDTGWAEAAAGTSIPLGKLIVVKEARGEVTERRVALYYYVKGNPFTSDAITMVLVEALVPIDGSYEGMLNVEKDFMALIIPYMFETSVKTEWNPLVLELARHGVGGYLAIALLLCVPLAIGVYPRIGRRGSADNQSPGNEA